MKDNMAKNQRNLVKEDTRSKLAGPPAPAAQGSLPSADEVFFNGPQENVPLVVFTLKSTDRLAPVIIRLWADMLRTISGESNKVAEALEIADAMDEQANRTALHRHFPD